MGSGEVNVDVDATNGATELHDPEPSHDVIYNLLLLDGSVVYIILAVCVVVRLMQTPTGSKPRNTGEVLHFESE